ncbi:MAG: carboxypeptidase regulatory-like protein [Segetibacter sp.]|nr:carboxypeptidase regulatory-like protein [Segetibacter sp.]
MKPIRLIAASLIVVIAFLFSCQKEIGGSGNTPPTIDNTPNITTTITGRIVDEQNKPVQGATIKAGSSTTTTSVNGEFSLNNVSVYDKAAFVQVTKPGYFSGSRTFVANAGAVQYIEVKLLPNQSIGTINNASGGTVALANGTAVTLPASSVVVASSNVAYTGNINVSMAWIDPTSTDLTREMPGDLRGINQSNTEMGMQSFGMVAVELTGAGGEKLQIAAGKKATVKFFLPASITAAAPTDIPLWSFDETTGLWKQEGTAAKSGNFYIAEVSHFSFWNCDAQFPIVDFTATIKNQSGEPLKHKLVRIRRTAVNSYSTGFTDSLGIVKGKVPSNEPLVVEVVAGYTCSNTILHTQNIGPFASAANISVTVTVNAQQVSVVTGTATNCAGTPLLNGSADLIINEQTYRASVTNGSFTFTLFTCSGPQTGKLVVTDLATNQQGTPTTITVATGNNNTGAITACGTSVNQFINYTLNGNAYSLIPPGDSLSARLIQQPVGTSIQGYSQSQGTYRSLSFTFSGQAVGAATITSLTVAGGNTFGNLAPGSATATITEYGAAGGFIAGSFNGNVRDSSTANTVVPVQGTFRVKRSF